MDGLGPVYLLDVAVLDLVLDAHGLLAFEHDVMHERLGDGSDVTFEQHRVQIPDRRCPPTSLLYRHVHVPGISIVHSSRHHPRKARARVQTHSIHWQAMDCAHCSAWRNVSHLSTYKGCGNDNQLGVTQNTTTTQAYVQLRGLTRALVNVEATPTSHDHLMNCIALQLSDT